MARYASEAERLRVHRAAFTLALELGCTPREAEDELRRRTATERNLEATRRLAAKQAAPLPVQTALAREAPWMMRD